MTAPATNGRGGWQEWATRKGGFMPPDARNQPPTGAKAPQQGARGERSTANGGAYEQIPATAGATDNARNDLKMGGHARHHQTDDGGAEGERSP